MTPDEHGDEQFYRDTESVAFPKLDDRQLSLLEPLAERRVVKRGELVYKAGQRDLGLTVVLRGEIEAFEQRDGTEQILATARERDFMGDVAMLQGTSALASARVTSPDAEILYVPAAELRRAFAELPGVSTTIVNALIMRRRRLRRDREFAGLRVLATSGAREGHQLDDFLDKNRIPHRLIEFESEPGQTLSKRLHLTNRDLPVLITPAQAISLSYDVGNEYRACLQVEGCGAVLRAKSVLIATGADYRRLNAEGREQFENMGVYYAATALEGQICRGQTVIVAGSGNSAGQAAMFLSDGAGKVLLVIRGDDLSKMSSYLSRRVEAQENIEILFHTQIRKMSGGRMLEEAELEDTKTGERRVVRTPAIFSMIGATPCTEWLPLEIERDEKGFIKTGTLVANAPAWKENKRPPSPLETSLPAIFAAGDVRSGSVKRCPAAVGEGGMAIAASQMALSASAAPS